MKNCTIKKISDIIYYYTDVEANKWMEETSEIDYEIIDEKVSLSDDEAIKLELVLEENRKNNVSLFNGVSPSLASDFTAGQKVIIKYTDYFTSLVSREYQYVPFSQSTKSNPIGVSCWAFTKDKQRVLVNKHSDLNNVDPGEFTCSSGGSMDFEDIHDSKCLKSAILLTAQRELFEEAGIKESWIHSMNVKALIRPNTFYFKPIFIVEAILNQSEKVILDNTSTVTDVYTDHEAIKFMDTEELKKNSSMFSHTLQLTFDIF